METPEVPAPEVPRRRTSRRHDGLPRWLELTIAVTALVTSISSIVIAIQHGHTMEKLVQANSIPYLEAGFSTATPESARVLSLDLLNRGVGPAHEESLRVSVDHKPVKSFRDLVVASLGREQGVPAYELLHQDLLADRVRKRFIAAGQPQLVFKLPRTEANARYWDLLASQQPRWDVELCYCSVFDECWTIGEEGGDARSVKQCTRDEKVEFMP